MTSHLNETIAHYRRCWEERAVREVAALRDRRRRAVGCARRLAEVLGKQFGARRVVLVGSTMDAERFSERSDIDLLVYGLPAARYFQAVARAMDEPFDVDIIPAERAHPMVLRTEERGEVLYEV